MQHHKPTTRPERSMYAFDVDPPVRRTFLPCPRRPQTLTPWRGCCPVSPGLQPSSSPGLRPPPSSPPCGEPPARREERTLFVGSLTFVASRREAVSSGGPGALLPKTTFTRVSLPNWGTLHWIWRGPGANGSADGRGTDLRRKPGEKETTRKNNVMNISVGMIYRGVKRRKFFSGQVAFVSVSSPTVVVSSRACGKLSCVPNRTSATLRS